MRGSAPGAACPERLEIAERLARRPRLEQRSTSATLRAAHACARARALPARTRRHDGVNSMRACAGARGGRRTRPRAARLLCGPRASMTTRPVARSRSTHAAPRGGGDRSRVGLARVAAADAANGREQRLADDGRALVRARPRAHAQNKAAGRALDPRARRARGPSRAPRARGVEDRSHAARSRRPRTGGRAAPEAASSARAAELAARQSSSRATAASALAAGRAGARRRPARTAHRRRGSVEAARHDGRTSGESPCGFRRRGRRRRPRPSCRRSPGARASRSRRGASRGADRAPRRSARQRRGALAPRERHARARDALALAAAVVTGASQVARFGREVCRRTARTPARPRRRGARSSHSMALAPTHVEHATTCSRRRRQRRGRSRGSARSLRALRLRGPPTVRRGPAPRCTWRRSRLLIDKELARRRAAAVAEWCAFCSSARRFRSAMARDADNGALLSALARRPRRRAAARPSRSKRISSRDGYGRRAPTMPTSRSSTVLRKIRLKARRAPVHRGRRDGRSGEGAPSLSAARRQATSSCATRTAGSPARRSGGVARSARSTADGRITIGVLCVRRGHVRCDYGRRAAGESGGARGCGRRGLAAGGSRRGARAAPTASVEGRDARRRGSADGRTTRAAVHARGAGRANAHRRGPRRARASSVSALAPARPKARAARRSAARVQLVDVGVHACGLSSAIASRFAAPRARRSSCASSSTIVLAPLAPHAREPYTAALESESERDADSRGRAPLVGALPRSTRRRRSTASAAVKCGRCAAAAASA